MMRKFVSLFLSFILVCLPCFAEETLPGEWQSGGFWFTGAGALDYTMTIEEDGSYFFLFAIQNYTGTEAQQVKITAVTEGFMEEAIIIAEPGMAGRTFFFKDVTAGDYTVTVENLTGGECLFTGCSPYSYIRLDTFDGAVMDQADANCFVTTLNEETTFNVTFTGGMFVSFFTTADQAMIQNVMLTEGDTAEGTIILPAGDAILYYLPAAEGMSACTTVSIAR